MPKVSVIIPVYGVEKYIERCARSLFEQTLDGIEYIFVDDCSPDKSIAILENIIKEYQPRLKKEHKNVRIERLSKNCGLPNVRRYGINLATGDYIAHCDSDDWVDVHMYEEMYNKAIEEDADVVVCDFCSTDCENEQYSKGLISKERENVIVDVLLWRIAGCLWNKLVRRKEYTDHDLNYPTHNMGEDAALIVQILWNAKRISYLPEPFYYYYMNQTSITKDVSDDNKIRQRFLQATANVEIIEQFLDGKATGKIKDALTKYIFEQSYLLVSLARKNKEDLSIWRRSVGKIRSRVYKCSYLSIKNKLVFYFLLFKSVI
ncbi:glycosyltransferase family 2 protein [Prevotella stercorea]|uniref:glycosyltransferase family 2 protein n=1 Tax=Leyella stercorea TaxID=363265 RepID=UPI001F260FD7|nr:glycosyltransferase family 2 protein [Leyella stercorea]MCF2644220.1 glycosyltransferase family 2 protein [Leyella stercorea]